MSQLKLGHDNSWKKSSYKGEDVSGWWGRSLVHYCPPANKRKNSCLFGGAPTAPAGGGPLE